MAFELNQETLRKGWGGTGQYWFSLKNNKIYDVSSFAPLDLPNQFSQSAYFLSLGYIPYFLVTNEEIIHAYINSLDNAKLKSAMEKSKDNLVDSFWKYFNVYPQLANGWQEFEDNYILEKAKNWCSENGIKYVVGELRDLTA
jgi:hypothetical protein